LRLQHGHKLALRRQPPDVLIRPVLFHKRVECRPRHVLQNLVKNSILMTHGVDLLLSPERRESL
jgi:hypothetical protein